MDIKYAFIGVLRGAGFIALAAFLNYLGDVSHLAVLGGPWPIIISTLALALEHEIESRTGKALFGTVRA